MNILASIQVSCNCTEEQAQEYLQAEFRYLYDLQKANDLRYSDFEQACTNLGLDSDWIQYFINELHRI